MMRKTRKTPTTLRLPLLLLQDALQASGLACRSQRLASRAAQLVSRGVLPLNRIMSPTVLLSTTSVRVQAETCREFHFQILLLILVLAGLLLAPLPMILSTQPAESTFRLTPTSRQHPIQWGKPFSLRLFHTFRSLSAETLVTFNSL